MSTDSGHITDGSKVVSPFCFRLLKSIINSAYNAARRPEEGRASRKHSPPILEARVRVISSGVKCSTSRLKGRKEGPTLCEGATQFSVLEAFDGVGLCGHAGDGAEGGGEVVELVLLGEGDAEAEQPAPEEAEHAAAPDPVGGAQWDAQTQGRGPSGDS